METDRVIIVRSMVSDCPAETDPAALRGLVNCLSPEELCATFDCSLNQPYDTRRLVVQQLGLHIDEQFLPCHIKLVNELLSGFDGLSYAKKQGCAATLDHLYEYLPIKSKRRILDLFFSSRYKGMRKRAYKRLRDDLDSPLRDSAWIAWDKHRDLDTARFVIELVPVDQIPSRFDEIESVVKGSWLQNRLYARMAEADTSYLHRLLQLDGISFAYACVKTNQPIDMNTARELYDEYKDDKRIGLLIWCYGRLRLWDVLMEIATKPKHEIYASFVE